MFCCFDLLEYLTNCTVSLGVMTGALNKMYYYYYDGLFGASEGDMCSVSEDLSPRPLHPEEKNHYTLYQLTGRQDTLSCSQ